uniref:Ig-like domain-containing protein n=1 Tax=Oreochromis aureus TaxID=47969 RepID=A0AAZ1XCQ1_OREAU
MRISPVCLGVWHKSCLPKLANQNCHQSTQKEEISEYSGEDGLPHSVLDQISSDDDGNHSISEEEYVPDSESDDEDSDEDIPLLPSTSKGLLCQDDISKAHEQSDSTNLIHNLTKDKPEDKTVLCWVSTKKDFTGPEGGSLTVQCRYASHYANHVKYWCHGWTRTFCDILARTDETSSANQDKVSISDDRGKYMFTVTMNDLKETDSGWYSCGVIIGDEWQADDIANTEVKVFHGVRVVNRIVSGEEGSSLTVQCLYTLRLRRSEKKWCRRGDLSSCLLTGSKGSYEDASVAISDDITGAFNVTLKKLQMSDAGGYLCSAGQQQADVQVQVRPHGSTKPVTTPPTPSQPWNRYR